MTLKKIYCKLKAGVLDVSVCRIRFGKATDPSQDNTLRKELSLSLRFVKHEAMKLFSQKKTRQTV